MITKQQYQDQQKLRDDIAKHLKVILTEHLKREISLKVLESEISTTELFPEGMVYNLRVRFEVHPKLSKPNEPIKETPR